MRDGMVQMHYGVCRRYMDSLISSVINKRMYSLSKSMKPCLCAQVKDGFWSSFGPYLEP